MEISIKYVQKFDQELYKKLIKENLEDEPYFIPSHKLNTEGDTDYKVTRETIRIGAFKNNELVGLLHGAAISKSIICMDIAIVEKNCRKQGVYSRMLEMFLDKTKHYDEVASYHHIFNNNIISLKLRKNFYIVGMDQSSFIGPRIQLKYFHNKNILNLMHHRVGLIDRGDVNI